ncbi:MAG: hypothetical protein DRI94_08330 [Bacteroidetes bacterium]|nr:MAG: hypothetical protein DRI94_08330 [Bacteroidota bacterium]
MSLVSIILPVYNAEKYLKFAIDSVLSQTYEKFELIIINDGSTDSSFEIIKSYSDNRIKLINHNNNIGYVYRLNEGIEISKGVFIARIDSDDIWKTNKLSEQIKAFEKNTNLFFIATDFNMIDKNGKVISIVKNSKYSNIKNNILKKSLICHSSIIFKKDICKSIGIYNENIKYAEDYNYWIRILSKYDGIILPQTLTDYRITNDSVSFKKRKVQIYYTIKTKIIGFKLIGFKFVYLIYIFGDIYRLLIPNWIISLKRRIISKNTF